MKNANNNFFHQFIIAFFSLRGTLENVIFNEKRYGD